MDSSRTFVLVHGLTQSPSGWDALRPELQDRGNETLTVDLRIEELADAGGLQCAEVIAETVKQAGSPVHLVGTSGSGALVPLVPSLVEVERLVFICAGLPDLGRSLADQIEQDHVLGDDWMEEDTSTPEAARKFMFNDCDEETTEWALKRFACSVLSGSTRRCARLCGGLMSLRHTSWERRPDHPGRLGKRGGQKSAGDRAGRGGDGTLSSCSPAHRACGAPHQTVVESLRLGDMDSQMVVYQQLLGILMRDRARLS